MSDAIGTKMRNSSAFHLPTTYQQFVFQPNTFKAAGQMTKFHSAACQRVYIPHLDKFFIRYSHSLLYIWPAIECTREEVVYDVNCVHSSMFST